jgi:hypothetical protein
MKTKGNLAVAILVSLVCSASTQAADLVGEPGLSEKGPNPLKNVYFGEQHLHTTNSPDAFAAGARQSWDDTYKYAMGEYR